MPTLDIYHGTEDELSFLATSKPKAVKVGDKIVNTTPSTNTKEVHNDEKGSTREQKAHAAPYYDIDLNYRLYPAEGGTEILWGGTMHLMRRKWKAAPIRTHNARGREKEFSLDTTGFQFEHFPSSYKGTPWMPLDEELVRVYNPEAEEFMRKVTGATDVRLISHLIRQRDWRSDPEEDAKKPDMAMTEGGLLSAHYVHVDQSYHGALRRLQDDLPSGEWVDHEGKHRWAIVNMWRPLEPIRREPLTLCDARSVRDDELHDTMHCVPFHWPKPPLENHMWQVTAPESPEQHKWWFLGGMTRDDVVLIKIFDSKKDGRARRAPHSAATTPDCFGPARKSIETRFFLFWEDDTSE